MRPALALNLWILLITASTPMALADSRVVHFPEDKAIGRLMVRDPDYNERLIGPFGWELFAQAQGNVSIPAGQDLKLVVYRESSDFIFLSELQPNDLQALSLENTLLLDEDFSHLKHLTGLKALNLSSTQQINGHGLGAITHFNKLIELDCGSTEIADAALKHIAQITTLEHLYLNHTHIQGTELPLLSRLTALRKLTLAGTRVTDESLAFLESLPSLERLDLHNTKIGDKGLAHVGRVMSLQKLILGRVDREADLSPITDKGLKHLGHLTELKDLGLYWTLITDAGLKHLAGLSKLEVLSLNGTQVTGIGFADLNKRAPLRALELAESAFTGDGLAALKPWYATLEELILYGTSLRDEDLVPLQSLKQLKRLDLSGIPLTDTGLVHLGQVQSLESISCNRTTITDAGLMHLASLPNLKSIRTQETHVTAEGLEAFKHALKGRPIEVNLSLRLTNSDQQGLQTIKEEIALQHAEAISLQSKPLPTLKTITGKTNTDLAVVGQPALICFADLEQRPSRRLLKRLDGQLNMLQAKGIAIIVIDVSGSSSKSLKAWQEKNKILFDIIPAAVGFEQLTKDWGAKSLPWLILTDQEQRVLKEGLPLDEVIGSL